MSWTGYHTGVKTFLMNNLKHKYENAVDTYKSSDDNLPKVGIRVRYLGRQGDFLVRLQ